MKTENMLFFPSVWILEKNNVYEIDKVVSNFDGCVSDIITTKITKSIS